MTTHSPLARPTTSDVAVSSRPRLTDPTYQAFFLLRAVFTIAPIAFGLDKFANVLTHWKIGRASCRERVYVLV